MSKIKTEEDSFSISNGGEWTSWTLHSQYGFSEGICYTYQGMIELYYQPENDEDEFYATARIIHNKRVYDLRCHQQVTQRGWIRIVKKWAKKIKSAIASAEVKK